MQRLHCFCNIHILWAKRTREPINYGIFINQFPPDIIKSIRQLERINTKICRQKMSILFNQICINGEILATHIYIYIYIYIYINLISHKIYTYIVIQDIGITVRVLANVLGDLGSDLGRIMLKTKKMVLDASLLITQHYKVRIKGKGGQS